MKASFGRDEAMAMLCELAVAKNPDLKVSEDSHLEQDLGFDSLDRMHLMFRFRERYGVTITAEDYIERKLGIVILTNRGDQNVAEAGRRILRALLRHGS